MHNDNELFWSASAAELIDGYKEDESSIQCLICGETYRKGEIYAHNNHFYDAAFMAKIHLKEAHTSMLTYLLQMNPAFLGLSEAQHNILSKMAEGDTDKEISAGQGIALSTIRNHRFKLREKEKQAKLFLAAMTLFRAQEKAPDAKTPEFFDAHKTAVMLDDRYNITKKERDKIIETYFDENGALKECPAKQKKKIVVLQEIVKNYTPGKIYTEAEVNRILKRIFPDFPYLRRMLIEYGLLERTNSGDQYWVKL